jgi:hypothetical protein
MNAFKTDVVFLQGSTEAALSAEICAHDRMSVAIQAEFDEGICIGTLATFSQFGAFCNQKAPCLLDNSISQELGKFGFVGISRLDLDVIGACAAVVGHKSGPESFWKMVESLYKNEFHLIPNESVDTDDLAVLYAFLSWQSRWPEMHQNFEGVRDVTKLIVKSIGILEILFGFKDDPEKWSMTRKILLREGFAFRQWLDDLNKKSFVFCEREVIFRCSDQMVNDLFVTPDRTTAKAVVAVNTIDGSIKVSFFGKPSKGLVNDPKGVIEIVFGSGKAHNYSGVWGSPVGLRVNSSQLRDVLSVTMDTVI